MQIIISKDIEGQNEAELSGLFARVSQQLVCSEPDTADRRNALASLDNITVARNARASVPPGF